jgi:hypothetical protein
MAAALGSEPSLGGQFDRVYYFGGQTLIPPDPNSLQFPQGMGSTTTTTPPTTIPTSTTTATTATTATTNPTPVTSPAITPTTAATTPTTAHTTPTTAAGSG